MLNGITIAECIATQCDKIKIKWHKTKHNWLTGTHTYQSLEPFLSFKQLNGMHINRIDNIMTECIAFSTRKTQQIILSFISNQNIIKSVRRSKYTGNIHEKHQIRIKESKEMAPRLVSGSRVNRITLESLYLIEDMGLLFVIERA
jgi:hypothetical protein